jgi:hypothetical protein
MSAPALAQRDADALARAATSAWPHATLTAIEPLLGDASARRYVRVRLAGAAPASAIAMLLPHDTPASASEELTGGSVATELPFIDLQRFLARHDVPVPALHQYDEAAGILLLEDLGDVALADAATTRGGDRAHSSAPRSGSRRRASCLTLSVTSRGRRAPPGRPGERTPGWRKARG